MNVVLYGAEWCADCHKLTDYFKSKNIEYVKKDIDQEQDAIDEMLSLTDGNKDVPTLVVDGKVIQNPTIEEVNKMLDIDKKPTNNNIHDVIMIGAGPAALTAAIYTTREDIETLLFEKGVIGGLASITDWVDNYPGFAKGIAGLELGDSLRQQAERFGAKIELGEVSAISLEGKHKKLTTTSGDFKAKTVLIATGSDWVKLGIPGEKEYYARGVHYCATCDGAFYRDKNIVVVGGGNSAAQEALFLTKFASKIELLVRSQFKASEVLIREIEKNNKITIHLDTTTDEIVGKDGKVTKVIGTHKGKKVEFQTDGVFVFVGLKPNTEFLNGSKIELDERGLIKTNNELETNMTGVFVAGDVRSGATMQIASAVGEGATAALRIREYLEKTK